MWLHGFAGSGEAISNVATALRDGLEVETPTLPGHGLKPLLPCSAEVGWEWTVDSLCERVDALGRCVLMGYSQGARLALAVALRRPDRVARLVLESGTAGMESSEERSARSSRDEQLARAVESDGVDDFMNSWERQPIFEGLQALPERARLELSERRRAHTAPGLAWALRALGQGRQPSLWNQLEALPVPTLLLSGQRDAKYTGLAKAMANRLPHARTAVLHCGHAPHLEAPASVVDKVRSFVEAPDP